MLTMAALSYGHVVGANYFCDVHPCSQSCDNPWAPGPELPHEPPSVTALSTANGTVALLGSRTSCSSVFFAGIVGSFCRELFHRERQEADIVAGPAGVLDRRALRAARGAAGAASQLIAGSVSAPSDHSDSARQRRVVLARFAVDPYPRRRVLQVAERRPRAGLLSPGSRRLAASRQPPRHRSSIEVGRLAAHWASLDLWRLNS